MIEKIVGISFNPTNNPDIKVGSPISIVHDKGNKYSSRAIAVKFGDHTIGHIGEKNNLNHETIFDSLPLEATVHTLSVLLEGETFQKFKPGEITHIEVEFSMAADEDGYTRSFTEPSELIMFKELEHEYTHNGKKLMGGSTYIKRWMKDFDKMKISGVCANSWGVPQKDILGLWDGNGEAAATFGTSIHKALEQYERYKGAGKLIQDKKDLPYNKALPTHPLLRQIVEDFHKQEILEGKVEVEVLVSNVELGLCGQLDRLLITGDKKCRVQDYKINVGADVVSSNNKYLGQFADLPKTKLSKYQLQMSFYARLLELAGWEVEGLDAFVYEDEWEHYPLDVLKLDF